MSLKSPGMDPDLSFDEIPVLKSCHQNPSLSPSSLFFPFQWPPFQTLSSWWPLKAPGFYPLTSLTQMKENFSFPESPTKVFNRSSRFGSDWTILAQRPILKPNTVARHRSHDPKSPHPSKPARISIGEEGFPT